MHLPHRSSECLSPHSSDVLVTEISRRTAASYYAHVNREENQHDAKPWKLLSVDEKKPYVQMFADVSRWRTIVLSTGVRTF